MTYSGAEVFIEDLQLKPEWGSQAKDHRILIRQELLRRFRDQAATDLMNLEVIPRLRDGFISISHAKGLGGFVHSPDPVGLDIETTARVRPELAARVGTIEEFAAAPGPAALWCAKEAVYKSLIYGSQPIVVMDLRIQWNLGSPVHQFILANAAQFGVHLGAGRIWQQGDFTLAVFKTERVDI